MTEEHTRKTNGRKEVMLSTYRPLVKINNRRPFSLVARNLSLVRTVQRQNRLLANPRPRMSLVQPYLDAPMVHMDKATGFRSTASYWSQPRMVWVGSAAVQTFPEAEESGPIQQMASRRARPRVTAKPAPVTLPQPIQPGAPVRSVSRITAPIIQPAPEPEPTKKELPAGHIDRDDDLWNRMFPPRPSFLDGVRARDAAKRTALEKKTPPPSIPSNLPRTRTWEVKPGKFSQAPSVQKTETSGTPISQRTEAKAESKSPVAAPSQQPDEEEESLSGGVAAEIALAAEETVPVVVETPDKPTSIPAPEPAKSPVSRKVGLSVEERKQSPVKSEKTDLPVKALYQAALDKAESDKPAPEAAKSGQVQQSVQTKLDRPDQISREPAKSEIIERPTLARKQEKVEPAPAVDRIIQRDLTEKEIATKQVAPVEEKQDRIIKDSQSPTKAIPRIQAYPSSLPGPRQTLPPATAKLESDIKSKEKGSAQSIRPAQEQVQLEKAHPPAAGRASELSTSIDKPSVSQAETLLEETPEKDTKIDRVAEPPKSDAPGISPVLELIDGTTIRAAGKPSGEIESSSKHDLTEPAPKAATQHPRVEKPAGTIPVIQADTAVSKPAVSKPAVSKPAVSKSAVSKSAVSKSAVSKPVVDKPAVGKPAISTLADSTTADSTTAIGKPAISTLADSTTADSTTAIGKPTTRLEVKPVVKPVIKPAIKPVGEAADKPAADLPRVTVSMVPSGEQPANQPKVVPKSPRITRPLVQPKAEKPILSTPGEEPREIENIPADRAEMAGDKTQMPVQTTLSRPVDQKSRSVQREPDKTIEPTQIKTEPDRSAADEAIQRTVDRDIQATESSLQKARVETPTSSLVKDSTEKVAPSLYSSGKDEQEIQKSALAAEQQQIQAKAIESREKSMIPDIGKAKTTRVSPESPAKRPIVQAKPVDRRVQIRAGTPQEASRPADQSSAQPADLSVRTTLPLQTPVQPKEIERPPSGKIPAETGRIVQGESSGVPVQTYREIKTTTEPTAKNAFTQIQQSSETGSEAVKREIDISAPKTAAVRPVARVQPKTDSPETHSDQEPARSAVQVTPPTRNDLPHRETSSPDKPIQVIRRETIRSKPASISGVTSPISRIEVQTPVQTRRASTPLPRLEFPTSRPIGRIESTDMPLAYSMPVNPVQSPMPIGIHPETPTSGIDLKRDAPEPEPEQTQFPVQRQISPGRPLPLYTAAIQRTVEEPTNGEESATSESEPVDDEQSVDKVEIDQVAQEVYEAIKQRLVIEHERYWGY
ncbi:MAG: hypothetical protein JXA42_21640 [Anaerolineales bacterium]|nr:hypothetical protein [Anaerolineales bacterium]